LWLLGDVDYVVDALALHDHIGDALRPILASPHILKVSQSFVAMLYTPPHRKWSIMKGQDGQSAS